MATEIDVPELPSAMEKEGLIKYEVPKETDQPFEVADQLVKSEKMPVPPSVQVETSETEFQAAVLVSKGGSFSESPLITKVAGNQTIEVSQVDEVVMRDEGMNVNGERTEENVKVKAAEDTRIDEDVVIYESHKPTEEGETNSEVHDHAETISPVVKNEEPSLEEGEEGIPMVGEVLEKAEANTAWETPKNIEDTAGGIMKHDIKGVEEDRKKEPEDSVVSSLESSTGFEPAVPKLEIAYQENVAEICTTPLEEKDTHETKPDEIMVNEEENITFDANGETPSVVTESLDSKDDKEAHTEINDFVVDKFDKPLVSLATVEKIPVVDSAASEGAKDVINTEGQLDSLQTRQDDKLSLIEELNLTRELAWENKTDGGTIHIDPTAVVPASECSNETQLQQQDIPAESSAQHDEIGDVKIERSLKMEEEEMNTSAPWEGNATIVSVEDNPSGSPEKVSEATPVEENQSNSYASRDEEDSEKIVGSLEIVTENIDSRALSECNGRSASVENDLLVENKNDVTEGNHEEEKSSNDTTDGNKPEKEKNEEIPKMTLEDMVTTSSNECTEMIESTKDHPPRESLEEVSKTKEETSSNAYFAGDDKEEEKIERVIKEDRETTASGQCTEMFASVNDASPGSKEDVPEASEEEKLSTTSARDNEVQSVECIPSTEPNMKVGSAEDDVVTKKEYELPTNQIHEQRQQDDEQVEKVFNLKSQDKDRHLGADGESKEEVKQVVDDCETSPQGTVMAEVIHDTDVEKQEEVQQLDFEENLENKDAGKNIEEEIQKSEEYQDTQITEFSTKGEEYEERLINEAASTKICCSTIIENTAKQSFLETASFTGEGEESLKMHNVVDPGEPDNLEIKDIGEVTDQQNTNTSAPDHSSRAIAEDKAESPEDKEKLTNFPEMAQQFAENDNIEGIPQASVEIGSIENFRTDGENDEECNIESFEDCETAKVVDSIAKETTENEEIPDPTMQTLSPKAQESHQIESIVTEEDSAAGNKESHEQKDEDIKCSIDQAEIKTRTEEELNAKKDLHMNEGEEDLIGSAIPQNEEADNSKQVAENFEVVDSYNKEEINMEEPKEDNNRPTTQATDGESLSKETFEVCPHIDFQNDSENSKIIEKSETNGGDESMADDTRDNNYSHDAALLKSLIKDEQLVEDETKIRPLEASVEEKNELDGSSVKPEFNIERNVEGKEAEERGEIIHSAGLQDEVQKNETEEHIQSSDLNTAEMAEFTCNEGSNTAATPKENPGQVAEASDPNEGLKNEFQMEPSKMGEDLASEDVEWQDKREKTEEKIMIKDTKEVSGNNQVYALHEEADKFTFSKENTESVISMRSADKELQTMSSKEYQEEKSQMEMHGELEAISAYEDNQNGVPAEKMAEDYSTKFTVDPITEHVMTVATKEKVDQIVPTDKEDEDVKKQIREEEVASMDELDIPTSETLEEAPIHKKNEDESDTLNLKEEVQELHERQGNGSPIETELIEDKKELASNEDVEKLDMKERINEDLEMRNLEEISEDSKVGGLSEETEKLVTKEELLGNDTTALFVIEESAINYEKVEAEIPQREMQEIDQITSDEGTLTEVSKDNITKDYSEESKSVDGTVDDVTVSLSEVVHETVQTTEESKNNEKCIVEEDSSSKDDAATPPPSVTGQKDPLDKEKEDESDILYPKEEVKESKKSEHNEDQIKTEVNEKKKEWDSNEAVEEQDVKEMTEEEIMPRNIKEVVEHGTIQDLSEEAENVIIKKDNNSTDISEQSAEQECEELQAEKPQEEIQGELVELVNQDEDTLKELSTRSVATDFLEQSLVDRINNDTEVHVPEEVELTTSKESTIMNQTTPKDKSTDEEGGGHNILRAIEPIQDEEVQTNANEFFESDSLDTRIESISTEVSSHECKELQDRHEPENSEQEDVGNIIGVTRAIEGEEVWETKTLQDNKILNVENDPSNFSESIGSSIKEHIMGEENYEEKSVSSLKEEYATEETAVEGVSGKDTQELEANTTEGNIIQKEENLDSAEPSSKLQFGLETETTDHIPEINPETRKIENEENGSEIMDESSQSIKQVAQEGQQKLEEKAEEKSEKDDCITVENADERVFILSKKEEKKNEEVSSHECKEVQDHHEPENSEQEDVGNIKVGATGDIGGEDVWETKILQDNKILNAENDPLNCSESISSDIKEHTMGKEKYGEKSVSSLEEEYATEETSVEWVSGKDKQELEASTTEVDVIQKEENLDSAEPSSKLQCDLEAESADHIPEINPATRKIEDEENGSKIMDEGSQSIKQVSQEGQQELEEKAEDKSENDDCIKVDNADEITKAFVLSKKEQKEDEGVGVETIKVAQDDKSTERELQASITADDSVERVKEYSSPSSEYIKATCSNEQAKTLDSESHEEIEPPVNKSLEENRVELEGKEKQLDVSTVTPVEEFPELMDKKILDEAESYSGTNSATTLPEITAESSLEEAQKDDKLEQVSVITSDKSDEQNVEPEASPQDSILEDVAEGANTSHTMLHNKSDYHEDVMKEWVTVEATESAEEVKEAFILVHEPKNLDEEGMKTSQKEANSELEVEEETSLQREEHKKLEICQRGSGLDNELLVIPNKHEDKKVIEGEIKDEAEDALLTTRDSTVFGLEAHADKVAANQTLKEESLEENDERASSVLLKQHENSTDGEELEDKEIDVPKEKPKVTGDACFQEESPLPEASHSELQPAIDAGTKSLHEEGNKEEDDGDNQASQSASLRYSDSSEAVDREEASQIQTNSTLKSEEPCLLPSSEGEAHDTSEEISGTEMTKEVEAPETVENIIDEVPLEKEELGKQEIPQLESQVNQDVQELPNKQLEEEASEITCKPCYEGIEAVAEDNPTQSVMAVNLEEQDEKPTGEMLSLEQKHGTPDIEAEAQAEADDNDEQKQNPDQVPREEYATAVEHKEKKESFNAATVEHREVEVLDDENSPHLSAWSMTDEICFQNKEERDEHDISEFSKKSSPKYVQQGKEEAGDVECKVVAENAECSTGIQEFTDKPESILNFDSTETAKKNLEFLEVPSSEAPIVSEESQPTIKHPDGGATSLISEEDNKGVLEAAEIMEKDADKEEIPDGEGLADNCPLTTCGEGTTKESRQEYVQNAEEGLGEETTTKEILSKELCEEIKKNKGSEMAENQKSPGIETVECFQQVPVEDDEETNNVKEAGKQLESQSTKKFAEASETETTFLTDTEITIEQDSKECPNSLTGDTSDTTPNEPSEILQTPREAELLDVSKVATISTSRGIAPEVLQDKIVENVEHVEAEGDKDEGEKAHKLSLFDMMQRSTKERQAARDSSEQNEPTASKEESEVVQTEATKTEKHKSDEEKDEEYEEEVEEEDEHKKGLVMVEAYKDSEVKAPHHKKHHNILSGMGSKVKHSISKVKKAITGKSSHSKQHSPK